MFRSCVLRLFYRFVYGRNVPGYGLLAKLASSYERKEEQSDYPIEKKTWDVLFQQGAWSFLNQLDELSRYSVIVGYIRYLEPKCDILDVGCGEGVLLERLGPDGYSTYVGLDVSEVAIAGLLSRQNSATRFITADAETYVPEQYFDVIVFNETLYYMRDAAGVAERYTRLLKPGGIAIVSLFKGSSRARAIHALLKRRLPLLDETCLEHPPKAWVISVYGHVGATNREVTSAALPEIYGQTHYR